MKEVVTIVAALLVSVASVVMGGATITAESDDKYRILVTGMLHGSAVAPIDDTDWYGLFSDGSGYSVDPVALQIGPCHDYLVDGEGESTGVCVSVDNSSKPMILLQCRQSLQAGPVTTSFAERTELVPGVPVYIGSDSLGMYAIVALGEVTDEGTRPPGDLLILGYTLKLFREPPRASSQVLVEYDRIAYDGIPNVRWVGDLDSDGRPDLLLDIRSHYGQTHYALYLSSEADADEMVKLVADLLLGGC